MNAEQLELELPIHSGGKYQTIAVLGRGGMADVLLAVSRRARGFSKLVVVKRLRFASAESEAEYIEMFLDEARLAARMKHPNIVDTYDVGRDAVSYFLAMEYLEGQTLSQLIKATRNHEVRSAIWVRIVAHVLLGLHYVHELRDFDGSPLQIVHRDVSPANVFVTFDGDVKLLDFGIAKARSNLTQTQVGMLKGKVGYMAPEQAASRPVDRRADIFSTGVLLWELIAGNRLLDGNVPEVFRRLKLADFPPLTRAKPAVDAKLSAIVERALRKSPAARFSTALEMHEALEEYLDGQTNGVSRSEMSRLMTAQFADLRRSLQERVARCLSTPRSDIYRPADFRSALDSVQSEVDELSLTTF